MGFFNLVENRFILLIKAVIVGDTDHGLIGHLISTIFCFVAVQNPLSLKATNTFTQYLSCLNLYYLLHPWHNTILLNYIPVPDYFLSLTKMTVQRNAFATMLRMFLQKRRLRLQIYWPLVFSYQINI
jgi:hypothetical protein